MNIDTEFVKQYDGMITHILLRAGARGERFDTIKSKVYERLLGSENYDPTKGKISTWLWYVVRSVIRNETKLQHRSKDALDQECAPIEEAYNVVGHEDAGTAGDEIDRMLRRAPISQRDREIFEKFHLEAYRAKELARDYDLSLRTVEQILYRVMQTLRSMAEETSK